MKNDKLKDKVALKAGIWYVVSSIMVKMVSVITTPMFTRLLSTDEYGNVATFSSWYTMFLVIYGLNLTVSIGRAKIDFPDKLEDYIGAMQTLSLLVSLILSAVICIFIEPFSSFFELTKTSTYILLLYLLVSPSINFYQSGYRYKYHYKQNIIIAWYTTLVTVVMSLALIFFFPKDKAIDRMLGLTIPTVCLSAYFWYKSIKNNHLICNKKYWKYGLSISLPMILHAISMNILAQSDRIVISKYWGATPVAYYSLVRNYALLICVITDAINQAWQPWFHDNLYLNNEKEIQKNTKFLVLLTCYIGLACIAFGPEAILILGGKDYARAVLCLPPMVLGVICQCTYTHYINIELHVKKTKYASQGTILAALLNIILNILFVPKYGYSAAAYTTFASYCVLLCVHLFITRKLLKIHLYNDSFMFGAMGIISVISIVLYWSYNNTMLRYSLILIGFISFVMVFRTHILRFIKKKNNNSD